ncbi:hypothetical protein C8Q70DRAFT_259670 [Cubamyces menziesii]|nr:hypothetical protein C8Q70DRAFT_259670 [Cubamyces menziesii]
MDSVSADPQLTSEFVKFLTAQLKECREELQKANQENLTLKRQLEAAKSSGSNEARVDMPSEDSETIAFLQTKVAELKEELATTRLKAQADSQDAAAWRARSNATMPETSQELHNLQKRIAVKKLVETMRKELESIFHKVPPDSVVDSRVEYPKFRKFMQELAGSDTHQNVLAPESRVVYGRPKLQLLSEAARGACDGVFAFFGPLLRWCEGSSHNALLFGPQYHYALNGGSADGNSWTETTEWTSLVGKRYEIFDTDPSGEKLVYVGTFLIHAGPKSCSIEDLNEAHDSAMVRALASRTFTSETKSQRGKAKTYLPALGEIYKEGLGRFHILGLQRVGFNDKFFDILRKAYHKRDKARASVRCRSETVASIDWDSPSSQESEAIGALGKHAREEEDEDAGDGAGPSKLPRSGENDEWNLS